MAIPVAVPATSSEKLGSFRKMLLVDPTDFPSQAATVAWETPSRAAGSKSIQPPDAPTRPARLFTTESQAPTALIPFATSTPARHPITELTDEPIQKEDWKTPACFAAPAPPAAVPRAPKRFQHPSGGDNEHNLAKHARELFGENPTSNIPDEHEIANGEWPSLNDNAVDMTETVATMRAERCAAPDIPKKQRLRYNRLLEYLRTFGNEPPISPSLDGELKTGKPIRGTSYVDVLRALFVNSRFQVAGLCEAVDALRKAGMPISLLGSKRAIEMFSLGHTIGQCGGSAKSAGNLALPGIEPVVLRVFKDV